MPTAPGPIEPAVVELDETITVWVASGFGTREEIVRSAVWIARNLLGKHKYTDQVLQPHAERLFDERLREHLERQQTWPAITDCDRLDAALVELEQRGVIARQCWGDDVTDGGAGIWCDALPVSQEAGRQVRGYVFYDEQSTASAVKGEELVLICGSIPSEAGRGGKPATSQVQQLAIDALRSQGLQGRVEGPYGVAVQLDWKRRRAAAE